MTVWRPRARLSTPRLHAHDRTRAIEASLLAPVVGPVQGPVGLASAMVLVTVLIVAMTLVYFGSVVNPTGHLHGLPVAVVNQDAGANVGGQHVNFGAQI